MDHLPYPKNAVFDRPLVPYVCTESYDGLDFLTYPIRAGWPQVLPSPEYPDFNKYELLHPSNDRELEKLFQTWIFFGLLHEILGPRGLYREEDYTRTVLGVKYVHTRNLLPRLSQWREHVGFFRHPSMKIEVYARLLECLRLAEKSLAVLSQEPKTDILIEDHQHVKFNRAIKISLAAICETIANAADEALFPVGQTHMPNSWKHAGWDLVTEKSLRRTGWCPNEIAMVCRDIKTFSAQYYVGALSKSSPDGQSHAYHKGAKTNEGRHHLDCTANVCEELRVKKGTYVTDHCCEGGRCDMLGPNILDIYRILKASKTPVLQIRGNDLKHVEVAAVPYETGMRYIAVSHVWGDGLGNETSNHIPRCQLFRLLVLMKTLKSQVPWGRETVDDSELYLWIDTLCCPVVDSRKITDLEEQRQYKRLALTGMRDVYEQAAYVLVLDKSLESFSYRRIGVVEAALRLFNSPWMHRLWTLQEAALAKNLVIQFWDQAVDLRTIWQDARSLKESDLRYRAVCLEIESMCAEIRTFFHTETDGGGEHFVKAARAVRLRRVSKHVDEALCIASVLKLDVSKIASMDEDGEGRMCELWRRIGSSGDLIPKDIIFNTLRRLRTEGLRWAPASLQQSAFSHGELSATVYHPSMTQATLISRGLLVKLPGFRIRTAYPHSQLPSTLWPGNELARDTVHLRHPDGRWFYIERKHPHEFPEKERPNRPIPGRDLMDPAKSLWDVLADKSKAQYLLHEDPRHSPTFQRFGQQMGLIANIEECEGGAIVMRSLMTVDVTETKPNDTALFEHAYELANLVREQKIDPPYLKEQAEYFVMRVVKDALSDEEFASRVRNSRVTHTGNFDILSAGSSSAVASLRAGGMDQIADLLSSVTLSASGPLWSAQNLFGGLVAARVMGRYAVVQESFGPDTLWCVD